MDTLGKDSPACHRKSMGAGLVAPLPAVGQKPVMLHNRAFGADHFLAPPQLPEQTERLLVTEFEHFPFRQGARCC